ncbi:uncharacterized protein VTP21DRAFT_736 [Calcarisporiella thermophila]|uniref:uncharacterized protein n=1 Tax=Calcarisporiella thermophila TaxID=911321 RepID=UPI0037423C02
MANSNLLLAITRIDPRNFPELKFNTKTTMVSVALAVFVGVPSVKWVYQLWRATAQFPGPKGKLLSGNLEELISDDAHKHWVAWNRKYGQIFQVWSWFQRIVFVGDPEVVAEIANKNYAKDPLVYKGFQHLSGNGLFSQMNQFLWKQQRKSLSPAFAPKMIREQHPAMQHYAQILLEKLDRAAEEDSVVDMSVEMILLTVDILGELAFGCRFDALKQSEDCEIMQLLRSILPELIKCAMFPLRGHIPILSVTRKMHQDIATLRALGERSVRDARERLEKGGRVGNYIFEILATAKKQDGSYMFSHGELVDNYVTFLVAGGDPTAHTMSFCLNELCQPTNRPILEKIRQELDMVIPNPSVLMPENDLGKLSYLTMVIKETLRMHGPGFGTIRKLAQDTNVKGTIIPKNTSLYLWNYPVHRDPRLWDEPDVFDPERFDSSNHKPIVPGSYFPFSYGPRNCMGQGLAMAEMKFVLATLLRRYEFSLAPGFTMEYRTAFTLCPGNGLMMKVRLRDSKSDA